MNYLFSPFQLRNVTLSNRIVIPPMCTYSAQDGMANDWHLVHLGSRSVGGAGMIITEATAISPEARITPNDLGLWNDAQIDPLVRVTHFMEQQGCVPCVQLAHAGRKASTFVPWEGVNALPADKGGWDVVAPSVIAFSDEYVQPQALDQLGIEKVIADFVAATCRAVKAGFKAVEIHAAHGYLLHQFLSPLANHRHDQYGGSLENRARLLMQVAAAVRDVLPVELPLLVRISSTDWAEGGWTIEESITICHSLKKMGVDLIDVSSGGLVADVQVPIAMGYQTSFSEQIRHKVGIATGTVGLIVAPAQAEHILSTGQADLVLLGRELLRNPYWPLHAATTLHTVTSWPAQYLRAAPDGSTQRHLN